MTRPQEIKAFKTTDGRVFETAQEAVDHQDEIDRERRVKQIVDDFFHHNLMSWDLVKALIERREELREALR